MNVVYIHFDTSHEDYDTAESSCIQENTLSTDNLFSNQLNLAGTESQAKLLGKDSNWVNAQDWADCVIDAWDNDNSQTPILTNPEDWNEIPEELQGLI